MTVVHDAGPGPEARAKWAFSTRRVVRGDAVRVVDRLETARSGDLVLGRVQAIGSHARIQLAEGRASALYLGDLVVLACGDRYAPDQFEGLAELDPDGADMLAAGGVLGRMRQHHQRMARPTRIVPLGLVADGAERPLNLARYALAPVTRPHALPVIGVVGTAMNAGKTTATAALAHGLGRAGHRVAAIKATGTGAFGDVHAFADTGAHYVADFTDAGMVSTYRQPLHRIAAGIDTLLGHAAAAGADIAVVELADGVFQKETADLLRLEQRRGGFTGLVFAAPDAAAATGGCAALNAIGLTVQAVTGLVSCSPLASAEAEAATGVPVLTREALADPTLATALLERMRAGTAAGAQLLANAGLAAHAGFAA